MMKATVLTLALVMAAGCGSMDSNRVATANQTIADIAMTTGMHNTFVTALKAAGLDDMMMQAGEYTVFAPTDAAFAKLPAGTLDNLLRPENREQLRTLLQYHVVPGRVTAAQVMKMDNARTVSGQNLKVMMMGDQVMIGNAHVVRADVMATNGMVHAIDTVLMPPGM
jgi:uncharacterized surface protein with fasciclin (FAS1) repeats